VSQVEQMPSSVAMIRLMGVVSLVCGLLIVATYQGTLQPIRRNQEFVQREAVQTLLPGMTRQTIYAVQPDGELLANAPADAPLRKLFAGYDGSGRLLGIVLEASERGYADVIRAMFAYSPDQQAITAFQVVEMKETPGLGDKINTDPAFLANFERLSAELDAGRLAHPIVAVKHGAKKNPWEIDAISGATISSRAVGRMLDRSMTEMAPIIARNLGRLQKGE
jgi:electron transport complex protein RnfG